MFAAPPLAALATEASAQSRTFYDSSGKVVGRSSINRSGTTIAARRGGAADV
jgi:hypothetical protein